MDNIKEKLIELVREIRRKATAWHTAEDIADMLIANGVTVQEWIPVTERLPENEQWVLCIMKDGRFRVFQWSYIDWQWNDELEWYDEYDVTCWMPLPQPPKEG
jgi:hypothetical protein